MFLLGIVLGAVIVIIGLLLTRYQKKTSQQQVITELFFKNVKIKGESNMAVEMQNDQRFFYNLKFPDDNGRPMAVEIKEILSTNPEAFTLAQVAQPDPKTYRFECRGTDVEGVVGAGECRVTADARIGSGEKLIVHQLAVSTIPNEAEGVTESIEPPIELP